MMEIKETRIYRIPSQNNIDPIDLFVTWYGEHRSQVVIRCWDKAWTAYWGGHWVEEVERFLLMDNIEYLVTSLARTRAHQERNWLKNIIKSIQQYLKAQGFEVAA
ncbi:hypothetical protein V7I38_02625 [Acinetobacter baumannii]|uniref:Conserved domain protein n=5 Tax=Acinetobacter baumannii TaxID=470 RepID=A0A828SMF7_ACIBA|nr:MULTISPECIES: hypothetical protein [Acinetobacter]EGJ69019.1 conserved domain protein [Acinetobacter baumannii 6014059]EHT1074064.1 hypothetical protein [Acinetobacter baumannii]EHU1254804.1 hypothetical protein [Acinetobacter baumannii]EHU1319814.1 hypothetical protein [Acinetobacter baumannii]EHU1336025.1 hypothetical protein [Acinetobacter baumannii]